MSFELFVCVVDHILSLIYLRQHVSLNLQILIGSCILQMSKDILHNSKAIISSQTYILWLIMIISILFQDVVLQHNMNQNKLRNHRKIHRMIEIARISSRNTHFRLRNKIFKIINTTCCLQSFMRKYTNLQLFLCAYKNKPLFLLSK